MSVLVQVIDHNLGFKRRGWKLNSKYISAHLGSITFYANQKVRRHEQLGQFYDINKIKIKIDLRGFRKKRRNSGVGEIVGWIDEYLSVYG